MVVRIIGAVAGIIAAIWVVVAQPTLRAQHRSSAVVDTERLQSHVQMLSVEFHPRNYLHPQNLDRSAGYIREHLEQAGARVDEQVYEVEGKQYRNVIGRFGAEAGPRLIVGAHYDSCDQTPGADDNASGVAGLIELAYLLGQEPPGAAVELVAYTLEEPPFFRTSHMGSVHHASLLASNHIPVRGVIVLEMIGYFRDEPFTQAYPLPMLYLMYPHRGNFIGVVGRWDQGEWIKEVKVGMKGTTDLPVYSIRAPASLPGVDLSDHMNYWAQGYPAVMLTDTAFYRNRAYHRSTDTLDRLDYRRMGMVVAAVREVVMQIAR